MRRLFAAVLYVPRKVRAMVCETLETWRWVWKERQRARRAWRRRRR